MTLLSGENISKRFEDQLLFDNLSFSIIKTDRIGLVGPNGIGKTTLFEILARQMRPDEGQLVGAKDCKIAYVEQELENSYQKTLFNFVASARQDILDLKSDMADIEKELHDNPESEALVNRLGESQHKFEAAGGYDYEAELKIILIGLGFPENRFHNRINDFSGGEKNRAALAKLLAGRSNLLLLDEPTNHLDIESTIWLEEYLKGLDKAYIIVSHDRAFLNNTIKKIWEITSGRIEQYYNGFENYLIERKERRDRLLHQFRHQQEEIKRIEDFIQKNMAGQKTKQAQSRQKYLARMSRIELPDADRSAPLFNVDSGQRSYNLVLSAEKAAFGYGHHALISEADFRVYRGERAGLIGQNGSGKTTILKSILGELDLVDGKVEIGRKVDVAYFSQELADFNYENTILDELWLVDPLAEAKTLRSFLARFGFRGEDIFKKISVLSGGEKTKLALAKLMFHPANFLIFDEPTNHLDIDSRAALEEALRNYEGTLLIVSHDRYFLDEVVQKIFSVENGNLIEYQGNYSYYKERIDNKQLEPKKKSVNPERTNAYAEFKKQSQQKGRIKKELTSTRSKINDLETQLQKLEKEMKFNIPKSDWEKLAEVTDEKSGLEESILELYNRLEELEKINAENSESDR